jgi:hypothetical protein
MFLVARGGGAVVFDFTEEPLGCNAEFVGAGVEGRFADSLLHEPEVCKDAARGHFSVQGIGVTGAVGKPLASTSAWILVVSRPFERPMHRGSAVSPVAVCGGPLFVLAPCWWTRIDELSIIWT